MFEQFQFFREYYVNKKYIGAVRCDRDRDEVGYQGRKVEVTTEAIKLDNGKKIKPGTEVMTMLYPFNGKLIKK